MFKGCFVSDSFPQEFVLKHVSGNTEVDVLLQFFHAYGGSGDLNCLGNKKLGSLLRWGNLLMFFP